MESQNTHRILVVDDEDFDRKLVRYALKTMNFTIIEAQNGAEALNIVRSLERPIDLVITDVHMPEMGGIMLGEKLKATYPKIKMLYMSGFSRPEGVDPDIYLQKGYDLQNLVLKVTRMLFSV